MSPSEEEVFKRNILTQYELNKTAKIKKEVVKEEERRKLLALIVILPVDAVAIIRMNLQRKKMLRQLALLALRRKKRRQSRNAEIEKESLHEEEEEKKRLRALEKELKDFKHHWKHILGLLHEDIILISNREGIEALPKLLKEHPDQQIDCACVNEYDLRQLLEALYKIGLLNKVREAHFLKDGFEKVFLGDELAKVKREVVYSVDAFFKVRKPKL